MEDNLIDTIKKAEYTAHEMVENAWQEGQRRLAELAEEYQRLFSEMEKEFQDKVSRVKNRVQVDSQAIIEDNNRRLSLKIAEIRQQGVLNREIFREFILKKILE